MSYKGQAGRSRCVTGLCCLDRFESEPVQAGGGTCGKPALRHRFVGGPGCMSAKKGTIKGSAIKGSAMQIFINGRSSPPVGETLAEIVDHFLADRGDLDPRGRMAVGTAHNGVFVPREQRRQCRIAPGDRIEILVPMQGG
jgi:sulfur carrier protein